MSKEEKPRVETLLKLMLQALKDGDHVEYFGYLITLQEVSLELLNDEEH